MKTLVLILMAISLSLLATTASAANVEDGGGVPQCTQSLAGMEIWAIYPGDARYEGKYICTCPQAWPGAPIYWCVWNLVWIRPRIGSVIQIQLRY
jgi:hypothetical protein